MKYILGLIMFFSVSLYIKAESVHLKVEIVEDENILRQFPAKFLVKFNAVFPGGKKLSGITLHQSTVTRTTGWKLSIHPEFENDPLNKKSINMDEYESLMSLIFQYISDNEELHIDSIGIYYRLVDSIRESTVSAIREMASARAGKYTYTISDRDIAASTIGIELKKSDIFDRTCTLLNKYLGKRSYYTCEAPLILREDISFQLEYYGKSWKDIAESEDGGLNEINQFSIVIKQNGIDRWVSPGPSRDK